MRVPMSWSASSANSSVTSAACCCTPRQLRKKFWTRPVATMRCAATCSASEQAGADRKREVGARWEWPRASASPQGGYDRGTPRFRPDLYLDQLDRRERPPLDGGGGL